MQLLFPDSQPSLRGPYIRIVFKTHSFVSSLPVNLRLHSLSRENYEYISHLTHKCSMPQASDSQFNFYKLT